ncbi:hypothetical protein GGQ92_003203 [Gracilibacillus halotolerans]|uniref:GIY-YIG catalytic domain-containing protein n=1 Tax=Gracilibacillus halotolerans TaxID=74386 RepID=A0A841RV93_9BACI|nr:hypothetical protein [Gracilibacillus halotolerans]
MIEISIPNPDITITERKQNLKDDEPQIEPIYGFIDFHLIPRDKGGIFLFYNRDDELLFVGKARKLRQRIKNILMTMFLRLKCTETKYIESIFV